MTFLIEIKETNESKPLIEHLKTLKYVKMKSTGKNSKTEDDIAVEIRKSEKSKRIKWEDAKKHIASWK